MMTRWFHVGNPGGPTSLFNYRIIEIELDPTLGASPGPDPVFDMYGPAVSALKLYTDTDQA
jgi:hypothetical protein